MKRLTSRDVNGKAIYNLEHDDGTYIKVQEVCDRLADYEGTGMEPEEIATAQKAMRAALGLSCELQAYRNLGQFDHLRELVQAEKEGRLVVLPCKVGGTAWVKDRAGVPREMKLEAPDIRFVCTDEDNLCMSLCNRTPDGYCAYRIKNDGSDIGDKILLTREEAEAAQARKGSAEDV